MYKFIMILLLLTSLPFASLAQSSPTTSASVLTASAPAVTAPAPVLKTPTPALTTQESGLVSYVDFGGSSNAGGHVFTLGFSAGYEFNERISVNARMPFYFVSATTTGTGNGGGAQQTTLSSHGMGNPSVSVVLSFPNRTLDYKTRVTTLVPVASVRSGFSTGSVLLDWANRFSRPVGRLLPFGQVDIANTVPDTPLFLLPYTAQGFNARFEGGTNVALTKIFRAGGSFYYVLPSGQQHVYSRVCDSGSGSGGGGNEDGWMTQHLTVGNDLTRDHGFSTWLTANLHHFVDLEIGYTRSYGYRLNTVSFGVGFDPVEALRHRHERD
jgi:hypothetical protein